VKDQKLHPIARQHGLAPTRPLDISAADSTSDLLKQMKDISFSGRTLGEAADVLEEMIRDERCVVVMTLTGAMTMAGLGPLIRLAVQRGWVQCLVSTGALLGHGMVEDLGMLHYKADPNISDEEYFIYRVDRVYDTLETEANLDALEEEMRRLFGELAEQQGGEPVGTWELLEFLGKKLPGEGILQDAAAAGVPIFIPAFTDSELALDLGVYHAICKQEDKPTLAYDGFRDLYRYKELCEEAVGEDKTLGIFTIGGGVPRNWAQQVGPFVDVLNLRVGHKAPRIRFSHGLRICPDPVIYGHLSGCTYSEGVSWGKFLPESEGGRYAEVLQDATVAWPILFKAMLERGL